MSVLETRSCSIRFGGVQAATEISIAVGEWEIVGIIGPNGAGKTTTFNIITGFYTPNEGRVYFKGHDITELSVHERSALGMGRTFQNVGMVKGSTVMENLKTAQHLRAEYATIAGMLGIPRTMRTEAELAERSELVLDLLDLRRLANEQVAGLPYGELKRVELAVALATDPDILLLDEPTSGMGPEESEELGDTLLELRKRFGLSIAMIEHHVPMVVRVCDYVYCLSFGQLLAEGPPDYVRNHPEVITAYLGADSEAS
ncbi:MAG TPA: ABC transporter ATP-binding protein [Actinomycetota bacterium]|nr:ABC transporter ATP-binding protein [Actinomycetota bacterium]